VTWVNLAVPETEKAPVSPTEYGKKYMSSRVRRGSYSEGGDSKKEKSLDASGERSDASWRTRKFHPNERGTHRIGGRGGLSEGDLQTVGGSVFRKDGV